MGVGLDRRRARAYRAISGGLIAVGAGDTGAARKFAAEADRLQVRRAYLGEFAKILPGRTVARFYQIENKMDAVLRYDLAGAIPVVETASGAPRK